MRRWRYRTHLAYAPEVVAGFLADLRNDKKWRKEVVDTVLMSGVAGHAGARYRETLTWEGLRAPATLTVSDLERGTRLVVIAEDPGYKATYEYEFDTASEGTDLELVATVEMSGPLQLVEPFMWAMITRWLERGLDDLERILTDDASTSR